MFSSDVKTSIMAICATAKKLAESTEKEVQLEAAKVLNRALDILEDEI